VTTAATKSTRRFYADLRVVADLADATRAGNGLPLPDGWHVALCDVRDSTGAIRIRRAAAPSVGQRTD